MSNTPGAQARASTHAGRNRPSDIDELRDNIADIAGGVGDMASRQYEQAYDVATDAVEQVRSSGATRSPQSESVRCWLPVGTDPDGRSHRARLTDLPSFPSLYRRHPWLKNQRR